jgi:hypothetical protein
MVIMHATLPPGCRSCHYQSRGRRHADLLSPVVDIDAANDDEVSSVFAGAANDTAPAEAVSR